MVGMEVNAGAAFDPEGKTVTQLVTWLQSQDQNASVKLKGGGSLVFRKLRAHAGGHIEVEATPEEKPRRPKSKTERALEARGVSKTDDPQEAQKIHAQSKRQTGPAGRTALDV